MFILSSDLRFLPFPFLLNSFLLLSPSFLGTSLLLSNVHYHWGDLLESWGYLCNFSYDLLRLFLICVNFIIKSVNLFIHNFKIKFLDILRFLYFFWDIIYVNNICFYYGVSSLFTRWLSSIWNVSLVLLNVILCFIDIGIVIDFNLRGWNFSVIIILVRWVIYC